MAITPVPPMTDIPPFPALSDRAEGAYNSKAFKFGTHMADKFNDELVAVATSVLNNAEIANDSAVTAARDAQVAAAARMQTEADRVQTGKDRAAIAAVAAQAGTAGAFLDSNPIVKGSGDQTKQLRIEVDGLAPDTMRVLHAPNKDGVIATLRDAARIVRVQREANQMLTSADQGVLVEIVSGTFTQTFDSPRNLEAGWSCFIRNAGAGDITIPLSDGQQNWIMYPNEMRLFTSDGAVLRSVVIAAFCKEFTSTSNFIKPPGYKMFGGEMWNGGESGGTSRVSNTTSYSPGGDGGKGGDCKEFQVRAEKFPASTLITVGAGGISPTMAYAPPNPGGVSMVGSLVTNPEGVNDQGSYYLGGARRTWGPGSVALSSVQKGGGTGGQGAYGSPNQSQTAGGSALGGSGGNGGDVTLPGSPGVIPGGGGGGGGGQRATVPDGQGGYLPSSFSLGGNGARGQVNIWGIA